MTLNYGQSYLDSLRSKVARGEKLSREEESIYLHKLLGLPQKYVQLPLMLTMIWILPMSFFNLKFIPSEREDRDNG